MSNEPKYKASNFKCPHCSVVAKMNWLDKYSLISAVFYVLNHIYLNHRAGIQDYQQEAIGKYLEIAKSKFPVEFNLLTSELSIASCESCGHISLWMGGKIVFPKGMPTDPPNNDLNEEIKSLYNEASKILTDSPRGSTALLRLALQMLLKQIGKEGKHINNDIKELVKSGLSVKVQKALDLLRVVGNNAVHPGLINIDDNRDVALKLFRILNIIADEMITKPKEIDTLYKDVVPDETKIHIANRDKGKDKEHT